MAGVVLAACGGRRALREADGRARSVSADCCEMLCSSARGQRQSTGAADLQRAPVEDAVVQVESGTRGQAYVLDVVSEVAEKSGAEFVLDDACRRRLQQAKVFICGVYCLPRSQLVEWLTVVLSFNDVALVPLEARSTDARPRWRCIDRRSAAVPARAAGTDLGE